MRAKFSAAIASPTVSTIASPTVSTIASPTVSTIKTTFLNTLSFFDIEKISETYEKILTKIARLHARDNRDN